MSHTRLRIAVFALVLTSFAGCERPSVGEGVRPAGLQQPATPNLPMTSSAPGTAGETASDTWFGFSRYPGARKLCEQAVDGFSNGKPSGGVWMSFASREEPATIAAFYGASATGDGSFKAGGLRIHPLRANYPSCGVEPRPGEKTVIVVAKFY
jgi:hypothetical protein